MRNLQLILMLGAAVALAACDNEDSDDSSGTFDCRNVGSECAMGFSCVASTGLGGGFECVPNMGVGRTDTDAGADMTAANMGAVPMMPAMTGTGTGTGGGTPVNPGAGGGAAPAFDAAAECSQVLNCANTICGTLPDQQAQQACLQQCLSMASPAGQTAFLALNMCIGTNCVTAGGSIDQACITRECGTELAGCSSGGAGGAGGAGGGGLPTAMGTGLCTDLDACAAGCPQTNDQSINDCVGDLSPASWGLYQGILSCAQTAGCLANPNDTAGFNTCLFSNCLTQFQACQMDGVTPGAGACGAVYTCRSSCMPTNAGCSRDCRSQGTASANQLMTDFIACTQTAPAAATCQDQACLEMACPAELTACQNDTGG
jgi:hypothetical protein